MKIRYGWLVPWENTIESVERRRLTLWFMVLQEPLRGGICHFCDWCHVDYSVDTVSIFLFLGALIILEAVGGGWYVVFQTRLDRAQLLNHKSRALLDTPIIAINIPPNTWARNGTEPERQIFLFSSQVAALNETCFALIFSWSRNAAITRAFRKSCPGRSFMRNAYLPSALHRNPRIVSQSYPMSACCVDSLQIEKPTPNSAL